MEHYLLLFSIYMSNSATTVEQLASLYEVARKAIKLNPASTGVINYYSALLFLLV